jgi:hypothetical protein
MLNVRKILKMYIYVWLLHFFIPVLRKWFSQAVKNKDKGFCSHIFTFLALWVNGLFKGIVRNNPYECELCEDVGSLLKDSPLIVVCPICSRPEDSIDAAIRKMPGL